MKTVIGGKAGSKLGYNHFVKMAQVGMKITIRDKCYEFVDEFKYYSGQDPYLGYIPGVVLKELNPTSNKKVPGMIAYTYEDLEKMVENRVKITYEP